jgi:hypothetical protein
VHKRNALAPGGIPHEKTELELARRIQDVFSTAVSDSDLEQLHVEDQSTAWFGMPCQLLGKLRLIPPFRSRSSGMFQRRFVPL